MSTLDLFRPTRTQPSVGAAFAPVRKNVPPAQWFSAVMGTGIVGVVLRVLWPDSTVAAVLATGFWILAAGLLALLVGLTVRGFAAGPARAVASWTAPTTMFFLGVVSMGFMTVGHGSVVVAADLLGGPTSLILNRGLWAIGSLIGVVAALGVPYLMVRRDRLSAGQATGAWFLPVVPPVVSAATGVTVAKYLGGTPTASVVLTLSVVFFVMGIVGAIVMFGLLIGNLLRSGRPANAGAPALLLPLGPLGQGATAAVGLGFALDGPFAAAGLRYAEISLTLALVWAVYAASVLIKAAVKGMPFSLGWWSFTFPVGTCVTGAAAVHLHTGSTVMGTAAVLAATLLFAGWALVATKSAIGVARGTLPGGRNFS